MQGQPAQQQNNPNKLMNRILWVLFFLVIIAGCFWGYKKFIAGNDENDYVDQTELTTQNVGQNPATIPATTGPATKIAKKSWLKGKIILNPLDSTMTIVHSDSVAFAAQLPLGWKLKQKPR